MNNCPTSLPLKNIQIKDRFWSKYIDLVTKVIIPYQWEALNDRIPGAAPSHCIENFRIAAGASEGSFLGEVFQDTDLAKWLEAVAYSLETRPDKKLEETADAVIELIGKSQREDGYINTYFTLCSPDKRWSNLLEGHELYTAGHFIEAAVAYFQATGKDRFIKIVRRFADYICSIFGEEEGKVHGYPGHQEIELALVKLYRVTGEKKYLLLAEYFINQRGSTPNYFDEERKSHDDTYLFPEFRYFDRKYNQSWLPVRNQETAEGHAVRACYMYAAMADLAAESGDPELLKACKTLYDNIVHKRMYITGSIGSAKLGEQFTCDYDLPNDTNYSETCASVGLILFSQRMFQLTRESKYVDTMEQALYNTVLAGISLEGTRFFYVNPLEVWPEACEKNPTKFHVKTERQKWFGCSCCPPNIARTLASLGQYIYGATEDSLYLNLFVSSNTQITLGGNPVTVSMDTDYPFGNTLRVTVACSNKSDFELNIRQPEWCSAATVKLDNETQAGCKPESDGYIHLKRIWIEKCEVEISFDMPAHLLYANPQVRADAGKAAIIKGPLVYCLEECDNGGNLSAIEIESNVKINSNYEENLLGGTQVLTMEAYRLDEPEWGSVLYREVPSVKNRTRIIAVPYCLWNNRGKGEMLVWVRVK